MTKRETYRLTSESVPSDIIPQFSKEFTYGKNGWSDVLTGINGTTVASDAIGNITNDGTWTFTWKNGRQLATMSKSGVTWSFFYDASGMRTQRTNGSTTYTYTYDGGKLTQMKMGSSTMRFTYGINGHPVSLNYDGTVYYYVTNAQGDVVGILNSSGQEVVSYTYDAWGNTVKRSGSLKDSLGTHNPLRYRGYVYDRETGLYYLQSRYYNPAICRFISADSQMSTGSALGMNLFAYCGNNPVNRVDPTGHAWEHWALGGLIVVGFGIATVVTCGGFAAAMTAVGLVANGMAAFTAASTVATAAFIGSATVYGVAAYTAALSSNSPQDFANQGNWWTVAATAGSAIFSGSLAYWSTNKRTTVYRSVSNAEAQDIRNTGRFNLPYGGMESKQFGFSLSETRKFGNMVGQNIIVSARIPNSLLNQLYTGGVDTSIFRKGTLTVYGDMLDIFNRAVNGTIRFLP